MLTNLAKMTTATTGTGTITLGSAVSGFLSFADSGISDGDEVTYGITDGANSEVGKGTYTASGTTLSRDTVLASTNSGSKISLSGTAEVYITAAAEDINPIDFDGSTSNDGWNQNRNTTGAFTSQSALVWLFRPIKLDSILWDIRNNATYTLVINNANSSETFYTFDDVVVTTAPASDIVFSPPITDLFLPPSYYRFVLTASSSVTWQDNGDNLPGRRNFFTIDRMWYNTTTYLTYTPPLRIVGYLGMWTINNP